MTAHKALTIPQVAELLQVTTETIRKMLAEGRFVGANKLDPSSPQSVWRIPRSALVPWCGPIVNDDEAAALESRARGMASGGSPSRDTLARAARGARGEDADPIPRTGHVRDETFDGLRPATPSGSIKPEPRPDKFPAPPVHHVHQVTGTYVSGDAPAASTMHRQHPRPMRYEGTEAEPIDLSTFGAGAPTPDDEPPAA